MSSEEEALFGPGGPYEIAEEPVMGISMPVFRNRMRSARDLLEATEKFGEQDFLIQGERRVSFAEHRATATSFAHALREKYDVEPGDRVAILAANSPDWLEAYWGTTCAGGVAAALNGWWTGPEIAYGLDLVKPKLLVADRKRLARIDGDPGVPVLEIESEFAPLVSSPEYVGRALPDVVLAEDDPALILFTSGTTGFPKGAVLSHRCLVGFVMVPAAARDLGLARVGLSADDLPPETLLVTTPMFHVSGVMAIGLLAMHGGAKCVLREGAFDPLDALRLIEREQVTSWAALGSAGPRVARHPDLERYDRSSVTRVSFGGAPTSPAVKKTLADAFPNASSQMGMSYGLSESSAMGTIIGGAEYEQNPESVGRPSPTVHLEIRDARGESVPEGQKGEIFIRSPYVMLEYWNDARATDKAIREGRWLATGDVGHFEEGLLYVHSRERDMILRSAENIYPVEIENRLEAHPGVREAAVVGVDHPEHGQEVKAVVVTEPGRSPTEDELGAWCRDALASFKVPTIWELREEALPRNASGKVLKTVLSGAAEPVVESMGS